MKNKKKLLVDLAILRHINCGLGQVALNYGRYFEKNYKKNDNYELYLLVPKNMIGAFGSEVKYIGTNWMYKHFPFLMPSFDVWHAIHQLSRFKLVNKDTRYILTIHDFNFVYEKKKKKVDKYLKKIQSKVDRADKIACISNFAKEETERYMQLRGKTIEVVYNGVEQLNAGLEKKPGFIKSDRPFFFTIGQVKAKKNFHVLLPLMKLFPEKELYIAGQKEGEYGESIEKTMLEDSINNVHLVGEISNEERIWLYNHCEAFLFPSLFEGFGLPVIEAMSFGKPVFSSKETSLREIGKGHAFFFDSFKPESMKKTIDKYLPEFYATDEFAKKNIDYAKSFSYDKHMEQYLKIYKSLL